MVLSGADVPPHLLLSWTILSWAPEASGPPTLPSSGQPGDRARYDQLRGPNSSLRPTRFRPLSCGLGPVGPSVALGSGHVPLRRLTRLSPTAPSDPSLLGGGSLPGWPVPVPSMKGLVLFLCPQDRPGPAPSWTLSHSQDLCRSRSLLAACKRGAEGGTSGSPRLSVHYPRHRALGLFIKAPHSGIPALPLFKAGRLCRWGLMHLEGSSDSCAPILLGAPAGRAAGEPPLTEPCRPEGIP